MNSCWLLAMVGMRALFVFVRVMGSRKEEGGGEAGKERKEEKGSEETKEVSKEA